jgi:hypothetical protein
MTSLTSGGFQLFTILATVLVTAATLLLWNRVRGPRPVRFLSRLGLLGSSYGLAAVAALVSINIAYGGLVSCWGELLDNLGSTPSTAHSGRHSGRWPGGPGDGRGFPGGPPPSGFPRPAQGRPGGPG